MAVHHKEVHYFSCKVHRGVGRATVSFHWNVCLAVEIVRIKERPVSLGLCFKKEEKDTIKKHVEIFSSFLAVCPFKILYISDFL